ncbi:MAG: PhoH family protein [Rhodospirillales bacterium]|nr:PhoH family protein [Rhodospirillales bacterium]MBO6787554.1 PhoH family protein [Rhodospirillales bacterium]
MSRGSRTAARPGESGAVTRKKSFPKNALAIALFGSHHSHLAQIESALDVVIHARGNEVTIAGDAEAVARAISVLDALYERLERGQDVDQPEVDAMLRFSAEPERSMPSTDAGVSIRNRVVTARTPTQADYLRAIDESELVFAEGPAGTGKTYLAVAKAVERLVRGDVERIILSRPAVEAGEQLGFLPGDMREKVDPYLRPLYDALHDMMPGQQVQKRLESGEIEVAPLAFMRGRTLAHAFVILDEAQNTTAVQMKMFLTRLGENSRMVITGDLSQVDLPRGTRSGLRDAREALSGVDGIRFLRFRETDVVRHPLVGRIVNAYKNLENKRGAGAEYRNDENASGDDEE